MSIKLFRVNDIQENFGLNFDDDVSLWAPNAVILEDHKTMKKVLTCMLEFRQAKGDLEIELAKKEFTATERLLKKAKLCSASKALHNILDRTKIISATSLWQKVRTIALAAEYRNTDKMDAS